MDGQDTSVLESGQLLTVAEVRKVLPVCENTLRKLRRLGKLPCRHIGRRVFFTAEDVAECMDNIKSA